jgi:DNA primase
LQTSNNFIEKVKREVRLEHFISRYVNLKQQGRRMVGLCPFHKEKSPSFSLSLDLQVYHCFGCGKSGDLIQFIKDYENVEFKRALEILSDYSGIPLTLTKDKQDSTPKTIYYQLNQQFLEYFQSNLHSVEGKTARNYLEERGISNEMSKKFKLGYALPGFDNFLNHILKDKDQIQIAATLGLIKENQNKKAHYYDFYRDRLVFPIIDQDDKVLGFGGRTIQNSEEAKYINSPASPIYDKGKVFYGMNLALPNLRKERTAILVEGYLDVIGLYSVGFHNVLAPLGTAFTIYQLRVLKNMIDKLYLMFDGDNAGRNAASKAADLCFRENMNSEIILLDNGQDPFDISKSKNKEGIDELIKTGTGHFHFLLNEKLNSTNKNSPINQKRTAIQNLFSYVKTLEKETDKILFLKDGAIQLGFSQNAIFNDFKNNTGLIFEESLVDTKRNEVKIPDSWLSIQRKLIALIIFQPNLLNQLGDLEAIEFTDTISSVSWNLIYTKLMNSEMIPQNILDFEELDKEIKSILVPYYMDSGELEDDDTRLNLFNELYLIHRKKIKQKQLELLTDRRSVLDNSDRLTKLMKIRSEINEIDEELRKNSSNMGRG